jgi:hypothetical protein
LDGPVVDACVSRILPRIVLCGVVVTEDTYLPGAFSHHATNETLVACTFDSTVACTLSQRVVGGVVATDVCPVFLVLSCHRTTDRMLVLHASCIVTIVLHGHASCTGTLVLPFCVPNCTSSYRGVDWEGSYRRLSRERLSPYHSAALSVGTFTSISMTIAIVGLSVVSMSIAIVGLAVLSRSSGNRILRDIVCLPYHHFLGGSSVWAAM